MGKRRNLLFIIPLATALVAFLAINQLLFTALGFIAGYVLMEGLRFLLLPPHLHRAVQHYQRGNLQEALDLAERSIEASPERWEPHYLRALAFFARGDLEAAEDDAQAAIRLNPDNDAAHLVLGQTLYSQERFNAAREAFADAVQLDGKQGINHYQLGATLFRLGRFEQAAAHLELALRLGIDQDQLTLLSHYYLGRALKALGHEEEAERMLQAMREHAEALQALKQDLEAAPPFPAQHLLREDVTAIEQLITGPG